MLGGYDTLTTSAADLAAAALPVATVVAEQDEWVRPNDVLRAMGPRSDGSAYLLEAASHDSFTLAFMRTVGQVVTAAVCDMAAERRPPTNRMSLHDLMRAVRIDKALLSSGRSGRSAHVLVGDDRTLEGAAHHVE